MSAARRPVSAARCAVLRPIRNRYGAADTAIKRALLAAIGTRGIGTRSWTALNAVHEDLLFLRAFPDSGDVFVLAGLALRRVEPALRRLSRAQRALADDSGVAGSTTHYAHPYPIARWLAEHSPRTADIDWTALDDTERLDGLLRHGLQRGEEDGFDGGALSTREWMALVRGGTPAGSGEGALAWLLASARRAGVAPAVFGREYDLTQLPVRWSLTGSPWSVTRNALSVPDVAVRTSMRRPGAKPAAEIARTLGGIRLLSPRDGARVVDVARASLAARCRETFSFNCANAAEVWMVPLGEGVSVAVIGVVPADRLSLEANYGYLLLSNGVPIGYGGVTPLLHQANTGINIFDPFRGSEAAYLWTQMLRAFHSLFGVTRFVVNAIQFGEGNEEAIASGAYWFYWRLGFRPLSPALRRYAEAEAARLAASPGRRSSARTLRHLATGDLHLVLPVGARHQFFDEAWLTEVSSRVTRLLEQECPYDHARAARQVTARVARVLGVRVSGWPLSERAAFTRLAPVVALLDGVERWSRADRASLAALMRAKGAGQERDFVAQAQAQPRFGDALIAAVSGKSRRR